MEQTKSGGPCCGGSNRSILWAVLIFLAFGTWYTLRHSSGPLPAPEGWLTDLTAAKSQAAREGKPILLEFSAGWCGPCRSMAKDVLPDPRVVKVLQGFVTVDLDVDKHGETAAAYRVNPIPAFLVLDSNGRELARIEGYRDVSEFVMELSRAKSEFPTTRPS